MHMGPAAAQRRGVRTQRRVVADPTGTARSVYEGHADRYFWTLVGKRGHLSFSLIAHFDPCCLEALCVEFAGADLVELSWIDPGETPHHLQQRQRCESWIFSASRPTDGCQRKGLMKLNDVDVVAGFSVRRQSQGFIRGRIE